MRWSPPSSCTVSLVLAALLGPGCGLTLDYDPPSDGGADVLGMDAPIDRPDAPIACTSNDECLDTDPCNGLERCLDGACLPGTPVECDDGNACNGASRCSPDTGECMDVTPALACDDGLACNGVERCDPDAGCVSGPPIDCDDAIPCTIDQCVEGGSERCVHELDSSLCPGGAVCTRLGCVPPTCAGCVAPNDCVIATCDSGMCRLSPRCPDGDVCCGGACLDACDDENPCTDPVCTPEVACHHVPADGILCDDSNGCTTVSACSGGACLGISTVECAVRPCQVATCDPETGDCLYDALPDGSPCEDGDACTEEEFCTGGACVGGSARVCDDGSFCTIDRCDSMLGCQVANLPDGTSCPRSFGDGVCAGGICRMESCLPGQSNCDGDAVCECNGVCLPELDGSLRCASLALCVPGSCDVGENCCIRRELSFGTCYDARCTGCCMPMP